MTTTEAKHLVTKADLAHLGEGTVAYLREMDTEELKGKFPGLPDMEPGMRLGRCSARTANRSCFPTSATARLRALSRTTSCRWRCTRQRTVELLEGRRSAALKPKFSQMDMRREHAPERKMRESQSRIASSGSSTC